MAGSQLQEIMLAQSCSCCSQAALLLNSIVTGDLESCPTPPLLQCGFKDGSDRLHLRLPEEVAHRIVPASPLAGWLQAGGGGLSLDADNEIVVVVSPAAPASFSELANPARLHGAANCVAARCLPAAATDNSKAA